MEISTEHVQSRSSAAASNSHLPADTAMPSSESSSQSASLIGFVEFSELGPIHETLSNSSVKEDREMASWININYLDSSLNLPEGPRRIDSLDHLGRLFRGYVRAKKLSNNTTPKEWPFLTPEWRKMTRPKVKQQLGLKSMAMDHTRGSSPGSDVPTSLAATSLDRDSQGGSTPGPVDLTDRHPSEVTTNSTEVNNAPSAVFAESVTSNLDYLPQIASGRKRTKGAAAGRKSKARRTVHSASPAASRERNEAGQFVRKTPSFSTPNYIIKPSPLREQSIDTNAVNFTAKVRELVRATSSPLGITGSGLHTSPPQGEGRGDLQNPAGVVSKLKTEAAEKNAKTHGGAPVISAQPQAPDSSPPKETFPGSGRKLRPRNSTSTMMTQHSARQAPEVKAAAPKLSEASKDSSRQTHKGKKHVNAMTVDTPTPMVSSAKLPQSSFTALHDPKTPEATLGNARLPEGSDDESEENENGAVAKPPTEDTPAANKSLVVKLPLKRFPRLSGRNSEFQKGPASQPRASRKGIKKPVALASTSTSAPVVSYFARIENAQGTTDIPISSSFLKDPELVTRYMEWKESEDGAGMDLTLEQFSKVYGFAKKT